jgi:serine protease DegS
MPPSLGLRLQRYNPRATVLPGVSPLKTFLQFITWPAIAGVLAALLIVQWAGQRQETTVPPRAGVASYADAVNRAIPAVVNIYTRSRRSQAHPLYNDPVFRRFFSRERVEQSLGSGVIVTSEGLVLTNQHVVAGADEILVLLFDGREAIAEVIGGDADTDIAVLRIALPDLQPIAIGDPDLSLVGDVVLAIGNPYGFGHSVSQGIISAVGRYGLNLSTYENFIQTDAAIHFGNSGGALIDVEGRLIGINTATFAGRDQPTGIGLATPSDLALGVMRDLVDYGKVIRGWLGLQTQPLYQEGRLVMEKLLVTAIDSRGPAYKAGIRRGDVITHIDGDPVVDGRSTMRSVAQLRPGEAVEVTLRRGESLLTLPVIVGTRPVAGQG